MRESIHDDPPGHKKFGSLPAWSGRCLVYHLQVPSREIGFVNGILESIGHLARIRTVDNRRGVLQLTLTQEWENVLLAAVERLREILPVSLSAAAEERPVA